MDANQKMEDTIDHLNDLILLDFDAARSYQLALGHVDDTLARIDLTAFLNDHERHIIETTRVIRDLGGEPVEAHRDFSGVLLEGMTRLRSVRGTLGALRALRTTENFTNRNYAKAAQLDLAPLPYYLVAQSFSDEKMHRVVIEAHISRLARRHTVRTEQHAPF
jgi:hypothetical protein